MQHSVPGRTSAQSAGLASSYDWLVVGAGLTGSTFARCMAEDSRASVLVVDRRDHLGGNVFDQPDEHGVLVHRYGPHIFHTGSARVWQYLSRFTDWYPYEHRVLAEIDGLLVPVPFNFSSLRALLPGRAERLRRELVAQFPGQARVPVAALLSSASPAVSELGEFVVEKVFRHYTEKQWARPMAEVDTSVLSRVPVALSEDDRYFRDEFQAIPRHGYTALVRRMLDHPRITLALGEDGLVAQRANPAARVFWTGQIDEYFGRAHGALPYRSLRFEHDAQAGWRELPVAQVNYPGTEPFTRMIDPSHFSPDVRGGSTITTEFPADYVAGTNEPLYPVVDEASRNMHASYLASAADRDSSMIFAGRLGDFRYYDMHQAVGRALTLAEAAREGRADPHRRVA